MRLHVWLTEEQVEAVTERAEVAGTTRSKWIRVSVQKVLETPEEQPGALQGAPISTTEEHGGALWSTEKQALENQIEDLEMQITLHVEQIRTLSSAAEERDRAIEARDRVIIEADRLREQILEERAQRIEDLKTSADKLIEQGERYQVLLQGAQQAALPEKAGTGRRPWWRFWE